MAEDLGKGRGELADHEERGENPLLVQVGAELGRAWAWTTRSLGAAGAVVVRDAERARREPIPEDRGVEEHQRRPSSRQRPRSTSGGSTRRCFRAQGRPHNAAANPLTNAWSHGCSTASRNI